MSDYNWVLQLSDYNWVLQLSIRLHFDYILCPSFSQIINLTLTFRSKLWYFARDVNSLLIFQPKCQPFSTYKLQDKNTQFLSNNNAQFLSSDCLILSIVNEIWTYCSFINSTVCSFMDIFPTLYPYSINSFL